MANKITLTINLTQLNDNQKERFIDGILEQYPKNADFVGTNKEWVETVAAKNLLELAHAGQRRKTQREVKPIGED